MTCARAITGWLLVISGCSDAARSGTGPVSATDPCDQAQLELFPINGATDVPIDVDIGYRLTPLERDSAPEHGPDSFVGYVWYEGDWVHVTTAQLLLDPGRTYTSQLVWSCGPSPWEFTTAAAGPQVPVEALVGRTWELDLDLGTPSYPEPFAVLPDAPLTVSVTSADAHDLVLSVGVCGFEMVADFSDNPWFRAWDTQIVDLQVGSMSSVRVRMVTGRFTDQGLGDVAVLAEFSGDVEGLRRIPVREVAPACTLP